MTTQGQSEQRSAVRPHSRLQSIQLWLTHVLEDNKAGGQNSIAALDGVRALAIIFVLIYHINRMTGDRLWNLLANPIASSVSTAGASGVTLFFVLSGFLLFMPYAKALLFKTPWPSARIFYLRRIIRIVPAYYVALFLLILFTHPEFLNRDHLKDIVLFLTFFMDSSQQTFRQINGPFWTLATEAQFYMVLPLITLLIYGIVRKIALKHRLWTVTLCLLGLIVWGLLIRYWGLYLTQHSTQTFLVPRPVTNIFLFFLYGVQGKYIEDFAMGMLVSLCYVYCTQAPAGSTFAQRVRRLSPWMWGVGILLLTLAATWHFDQEHKALPFLRGLSIVYDWLNDSTVWLGYGLCVAAILFGSPAFRRPFTWPVLRWIGLISYSLYIWHLPLLVFFQVRVLPMIHGLGRYSGYSLYWVWAVIVVVPFCLLSFIWIEKPWMKLGDQWRRRLEKNRLEKHKLAAVKVTSSSFDSPSIT